MNTENFINKLNSILEYYHLSASSLADKIGVPRSSISHLLSGRNKPSLDFILKLVDAFSEIELDWLVLDKGSFPKKEIPKQNTKTITPVTTQNNTSKEIVKIVFFYNDGSFETFNNQ